MAIIVILCGAPHLYKKDMNNSGLSNTKNRTRSAGAFFIHFKINGFSKNLALHNYSLNVHFANSCENSKKPLYNARFCAIMHWVITLTKIDI